MPRNKEKKKEYDRLYYLQNREKILQRGREYHHKVRKFKERNKEPARKSMLRYYYRNRIARNMSNRIRQSLKGERKTSNWETLVGYTLEDLKTHLEEQFKSGMTWENHGDWHIDHIRPISSFNIIGCDCEDFKECWSLDNLQPLWAEENWAKKDKYNIEWEKEKKKQQTKKSVGLNLRDPK